jgi:hypothetical protein
LAGLQGNGEGVAVREIVRDNLQSRGEFFALSGFVAFRTPSETEDGAAVVKKKSG